MEKKEKEKKVKNTQNAKHSKPVKPEKRESKPRSKNNLSTNPNVKTGRLVAEPVRERDHYSPRGKLKVMFLGGVG